MENINKEKLYNFISHAAILFLLFIIVYLMYIDYIREKISIRKIISPTFQEKFNNLISNNDNNVNTVLTPQNMKQEKEHFMPIDPDLKYIIKRNYNNINNALCLSGDSNDPNNNKCFMPVTSFYPTQSYLNSAITISSLPDSINDKDISKSTFYADVFDENNKKIPYNDYYEPIDSSGTGDVSKKINLGYKSNYFLFYFSINNKENRKFNYSNPLESKIIQYFINYLRYNGLVGNIKSNDINILKNSIIIIILNSILRK
jgi:hypothetical protein